MLPSVSERAPLLVMAVGNLLKEDDGFGLAVLEELERRGVPADVELFDAGTAIVDLMEIFNGRRKLVVIDAVSAGNTPGTLYRFSPEDVEMANVPQNSLHQTGLIETLHLGELVDCRPESTVIIGVEPSSLELKIGLTEPVQAAVNQAADLVIKEIM
jgi:hydrogenase maturation protease